MKNDLHTILRSYSDIFFLHGPAVGLTLFAVTLVSPFVAMTGITAVLAAYCFARFIGMKSDFLSLGFYTYNPLLVGLSLGYLFEATPLTMFLVVAAGVFTFVLTVVMANVLHTYLKLPVLSLPFVVVSSMAYLASLRYSNLVVASPYSNVLLTMDFGLPQWLAGYFQSFGAILFAPSVVVGALFSATVLYSSRILFLLSVLGYYVGTVTRALMLGSSSQAFGDTSACNFLLIAMALGGVFLVPSLTSYAIAAIAVVMTTLFLDSMTVFWSYYGIPVFVLPFNVTTLGMVYVLGLIGHPLVAKLLGRTPEETLDQYLTNKLRYPGSTTTLALPFAGRWTVWQAFDGPWTHKGNWRHAYDFVLTDEEGSTHGGEGSRLEQYYAFGKPVLSPVRGRVVRVVADLPDNPVGTVDRTNNWGNLALVHDPRGFHAMVCHLAEGSVRVNEGDWVERGTMLGACGNSGYSPQPHLHVQAQAVEMVGAATIPFSFVSYTDGETHFANDLPPTGAEVEPLYIDKRMNALTEFVLDDVQEFEITRSGEDAGRLSFTVEMADDGTLNFRSDRGRLYFGKHEGTFYVYRLEGDDEWLKRVFVASPRVPTCYREGLAWRDYVPAGLVTSGLRRATVRCLGSVWPNLSEVNVKQSFAGPNRIESVIESPRLHIREQAAVEFNGYVGFSKIEIGEYEMRRVSHEGS